MNLTVIYYGQLSRAIGRDQESLQCSESATVHEVLRKIADLYGQAARTFLFDAGGEPSKSLLVTVNDVMIEPGSTTVLGAGDEVALLPPIAGG